MAQNPGFTKSAAYEAEQRRKRVIAYTGYSVVGAVFVLLMMILSGDKFAGILRIIGLQGIYNAESGVYADCSKPENKDVSYCRPKLSQTERNWRDLTSGGRRGTPFTLHGD